MLNCATKQILNSAHSIEISPYQGFALLYDALLGNQMLPLFIRNFKWLVNHYNIFFRALADVACGTGGFALHLSRWNLPVFGVDASPSMIDIARRKNRNKPIRFFVQDMRRLQLPCPVDLITCNFDSLNYLLTLYDLKRAFRSFNLNLTKSGHLIFDMITDTGQNWGINLRAKSFRSPGIVSIWIISQDPVSRIRKVIMKNFVKMKNGTYRCEREIHKQRAYPINTIHKLLKRCGFKVIGMHNAYSLLPATRGDNRVVFVAKKG